MSSAASVADKIITPTFKGQKYEDIVRNQTYAKDFVFSQEYEYSNEVAAGVVIRQTPLPGEETKSGTMVHLVISQGPKTAIMPAVQGHDIDSVIAKLTELGIQYRKNFIPNNGQYTKNYVVYSSIAEGAVVNLETDIVYLDVAGEVQSPSTSSSSTSSSTVEDPSAGGAATGGSSNTTSTSQSGTDNTQQGTDTSGTTQDPNAQPPA